MSEAPWRMPEVMADITPEFAAVVERRSRAGAARATRIVCPSRAAAEQIADVFSFPRERVDVVFHGVDSTRFRPAGERHGRPYVLFVSQLHPRKNLAVLREALAFLPGLELVIVGAPAQDRPDTGELRAAALAPIDGVTVRASTRPTTRRSPR